MRYAACTAYLRSSASTASASKAIIATDTKVLVATQVTGAAWSARCAGNPVSGSTWYQISAVNGQTVQSLYGVSYVYCGERAVQDYGHGRAATDADTYADAQRRPRRPAHPTPGTRLEGIDISHWQGTINWTSVAAAGKKFAFIKATEDADFSDPTYTTNHAGAKAAGLRSARTTSPSRARGRKRCGHRPIGSSTAPRRPAGDLLPVLDLERSNGLTPAQLTTWVQDFLGRVYTRLGVRGMIYCSPSFWKTYMGDTAWFASNGYSILWIAHWTTGASPTVPAANWGGKSWTFWQYTSDGTVAGISGRVDMDRYNGTDLTKVRIP